MNISKLIAIIVLVLVSFSGNAGTSIGAQDSAGCEGMTAYEADLKGFANVEHTSADLDLGDRDMLSLSTAEWLIVADNALEFQTYLKTIIPPEVAEAWHQSQIEYMGVLEQSARAIAKDGIIAVLLYVDALDTASAHQATALEAATKRCADFALFVHADNVTSTTPVISPTALPAVKISESPSPASEAEKPTALITGNASEVLPPGDLDELTVIAFGSEIDGEGIPVVVRNNTGSVVIGARVTASVRDSSGNLVAADSGRGLGLLPHVIEPDGLAFGAISFDGAEIPVDATFEFQVHGGSADDSSPSWRSFEMVEAAVSVYSDIVIGITRNQFQESPYATAVAVICFSTYATVSDYTVVNLTDLKMTPGQVVPFQVEVDSCPYFLVSAYGYNGWE